jgi:Cu/Ag efflux protein CusF
MKTILSCATVILGILTVPGFNSLANAGTPPASSTPAASDTNYTGMVTAVNEKDKTVTVKQFLFDRTFNLADNCKIVLADGSKGDLSDIRAGQKLDVQFAKERGVYIAYQITRQNLTFTGYIDVINPASKFLVVKSGLQSPHFKLAKDCSVIAEGGKDGSLDDLKPGQTVSVNYEEQNGNKVARSVERDGVIFSGTLEIIDKDHRIVRAHAATGTRRFNLADGCIVVANGKVDTGISQLNLGDEVNLCYDDVNGVLVANWISRENSAMSKAAPETKHEATSKTGSPGGS